MRRRSLLAVLASLGAAMLADGCGGGPPPTTLAFQLSGDAGINPDRGGAPKPLRVRVLQLASTTRLSQANFFALDADPAKALGPEFLAVEEVVLGPGQSLALEPEAKPGVRFVGVVGAYFSVESARWRAWAPVKAGAANAYTVKLDAAGIAFAGTKA